MKNFNVVSNLAYLGFPVAQGRPPEEERFATQDEARRWLIALRCGGSISTHRDGDFRVVEEVMPGAVGSPAVPLADG